MPGKRPPSRVELDYRRERKRIQNFIRRAQKRGYVFNEFELPAIPKKVTEASVRRLKKFTPDYLYGKSVRIDVETGEYEAGPVARKRERSQSAKRSAETMRKRRERRGRERREYERREREAIERGIREERERQRQIEEQQDRERERQRLAEEQEYEQQRRKEQEPKEYIKIDTAILDRTREEWSHHSSGLQYSKLVSWLNALVASQGEAFACDILAMAESAGVIPTGYEFYNEAASDKYIDEMISFMHQHGQMKEMTADQMEALGMMNEFL